MVRPIIRPPLVILSAFLKKFTMTKSSANFPSVEPNGQGFYVLTLLAWVFRQQKN